MDVADRLVLDVLYASARNWITASEWQKVVDGVAAAGGVRYATGWERTVLEKAARQSFGGNRSAAGRYAANVRWGGRSGVADPARVAALRDTAVERALMHTPQEPPETDPLVSAFVNADGKWIDPRQGPKEYYAAKRAELGFDAPAQKCSAEEAQALVDSGEFVVVYRGSMRPQTHWTQDNPPIADGEMGKGFYATTRHKRAEYYTTAELGGDKLRLDIWSVENRLKEGFDRRVTGTQPDGTKIYTKIAHSPARRAQLTRELAQMRAVQRSRAAKADPAVHAYLIPRAGLTGGRTLDDAWGYKGFQAIQSRQNASYGQSSNFGGTDDFLIHNIGMMIQAPKGWRPRVEQTWAESHDGITTLKDEYAWRN